MSNKVNMVVGLLGALVLSLTSCDLNGFDIQPDNNTQKTDTTNKDKTVPFDEDKPVVYSAKTATLLDKTGWTVDTLESGCVWYSYQGTDPISNSPQAVNVLEADLTSGKFILHFYRDQQQMDSISNMVAAYRSEGHDVMGACNVEFTSGYERVDRHTYQAGVAGWPTEAAVMVYDDNTVRIRLSAHDDYATAINNYARSSATGIFSSGIMLIDNGKNIGSYFYNYISEETYNNPNYEYNYTFQQRQPRCIVATTADGDLLFITITGRFPGIAEGMTADEMTRFILKYFNPQYALNMDGGGSVTLVVKGRGDQYTNVVNYPTDNGKFDHWGQRPRRYAMMIEKVK